uniref:tetraspanin-8 isoform X1 n=1 Tax=Monopterus albus TaxID=43700 RepID=UPI0009B38E5C|nr:tetraspanin-8 isoform X1 [Monopterus albus]
MAVNKCVKYLLFIFNLLFWLSGCLILAVAIYTKVSKDGNQITNQYLPAVDLMIAIGVIIMVLGFLGCCGAIKENRCMLLLFFIFLLLIFILLVAAGILGAVGDKKVDNWIKERLMPLSDQPASVKDELEKLQRQLKCCGLFNGPSDWDSVPDSCHCNSTVPECPSSGVYQTPCGPQIVNLLQSQMKVALGIAFAIAVLLIFGMVFSMMLYCQIGRKENTVTVSHG